MDSIHVKENILEDPNMNSNTDFILKGQEKKLISTTDEIANRGMVADLSGNTGQGMMKLFEAMGPQSTI